MQSQIPRSPQHLILYDGMCALCNRAVRFLLAIDKRRALAFAPLQGETARCIARRRPECIDSPESIILVCDYNSPAEHLLRRSDAVLRALHMAGGAWGAFSCLRVVPRRFRDWIYDFVAHRRYRWFGRYSSCRLPEPHELGRFLP